MRRAAALVLFAVSLMALSGCTGRFVVDVEMDREGAGRLVASLSVDAEGAAELGLVGSDEDVARAALGLFPWLAADPGWVASDDQPGRHIAVQRDEGGSVAISSRHAFESVPQMRALLTEARPLATVPRADTVDDLAAAVPFINALTFTLGDATGDFPGFDLFARGGVGELQQATCSGNRLLQAGSVETRLRQGFEIVYRFTLPGGPGRTNADDVRSGRTAEWSHRFGDCPAIRATSGGGSSSTLINGIILAVASVLIGLVLVLRAFRRRVAKAHASGGG